MSAATRPSQRFSVELLGHTWELERHGDLESLWQAMGEDPEAQGSFENDERLPYWTELWPSSMLLGRWLGEHARQIRGHWCLDLGCGLGLDALAGAHCGARVLGIDYEWPAVFFARRNAMRNQDKLQGEVRWSQMDWRAPALKPGVFAYIWGADVMYESRFAKPLAAVLELALAPGGKVWIAEPGRAVYAPFVERMRALEWRCEHKLREKTPQVTSVGPPATVSIWELTRY